MKRLDARTGLLVAALIAVAAAIVWAFLSPGHSSRTAADVVAGRTDAFEAGQPVSFEQGRFWLVREPDGSFLALSWKDPNDGCTVPWRPTFEFLDSRGWFRNPCHAQTYDLEGACRFGKCDRGLDRFAVRIERGVVVVDTSTTTPGPPARGLRAVLSDRLPPAAALLLHLLALLCGHARPASGPRSARPGRRRQRLRLKRRERGRLELMHEWRYAAR